MVSSAGHSWGTATSAPAASGSASSGGSSPIGAFHRSQGETCDPPAEEQGGAAVHQSSFVQQGWGAMGGGMAGPSHEHGGEGHGHGQGQPAQQEWACPGEDGRWSGHGHAAAKEVAIGQPLLAADSVSPLACEAAVAQWEREQGAGELAQEALQGEMEAVYTGLDRTGTAGLLAGSGCTEHLRGRSCSLEGEAGSAGGQADHVGSHIQDQPQLAAWNQSSGGAASLAVRLLGPLGCPGEEPRVLWQHTFGELCSDHEAAPGALPLPPTRAQATPAADEGLQLGCGVGGASGMFSDSTPGQLALPAPVTGLPGSVAGFGWGAAFGASVGGAGSSSPHMPLPAPSQAQPQSSMPAGTATAPLRGTTLAGGVVYLTPQLIEQEIVLGRLLGVGSAGSVYGATWRGRQVRCSHMSPGWECTAADQLPAEPLRML